MEKWIKPGVSVTFVEKKINKPFHPETESDSINNDDNNDDCDSSNENTMEVSKNKQNIGPSETDVDDNFTALGSSKLNIFECDKTLKED